MATKTIFKVWLVHAGFHTFWVFVFGLSLLGAFILIPLIGWYSAFVLGFMGTRVLSSTLEAMLLGYAAFSASGLLAGCLISLARPKAAWVPAFVSLLVTCLLFVGASWAHYKHIGLAELQTVLPLPETTGRPGTDELSLALKDMYLNVEPPAPPYRAGSASIIPLSEIQPSLKMLPKDFQLAGGPYTYCNLPTPVWQALRRHSGSARYPLAWSTQAEPSGERLVFSVDLRTDVFHDELLTADAFSQRLRRLESDVQAVTGETAFKLQPSP
jgi:hypothetical protein